MKNLLFNSTLILCLVVGSATVVFSQENNAGAAPNIAAAQVEAMKKLNFLVGNWRGTGWMIMPTGKRETSQVNESVQMKLGGTVLLVEGIGKRKMETGGAEITVHNALAVLSYDAQQKVYRWRTYTAQGYGADTTAEIGDKRFVWNLKLPQGGMETRYTITLNDKGNWFEIGEATRDGGKTWMKFFEMELEKVS